MRRQRTPGPGAYNQDVRPITPSSPSYTMAPKTHLLTGSEGQPGPGTYNYKGTFAGPAYTIPGKHPSVLDQERKLIPGPGAYNVGPADVTHHREPAFTLAGRRRSDAHHAFGPGPGAYTLPRVEGGPAHSMPGKRSAPTTPKSPGPGAYTPLLSRPGSPAYTMATRHARLSRDASPGPGQYQPRISSHGPAYTMPGRSNGLLTSTTTPGPGAYQLELGTTLTHHKDPAYSMSSRRKASVEESGPGPGTYTPLTSSRTEPGPAYTIGGRKTTSLTDSTPGPGSYYREGKPGSPAFSIAGKTPASHAPVGPGPGAYSPKEGSHGPAFSIPRRFVSMRKGGTPGPAAYSLDINAIHYTPPKFSMGMRYDDKGREICPGPGSYDPRLRPTAPAYSMSSGTPRFDFF